mgnify:FL=1|jgi:hypothetical protein|tara:strand:- start:2256 stop:2501 length:246 start_codon:yes stop_codon:yes gene_type:complete
MKYYIMMPGDTNESTLFESNELGEDTGFGTFWAASGLKKLMSMVDKSPELLEIVQIKTDKGKTITIEEFLDSIKRLKVRIN